MDKIDFNEVYEECKANVWKLVSKYVISSQDREDLFQEVFLAVHKALTYFRGDSSVSTWVYKITVNTAINYVNKQKRYRLVKNILVNLRVINEEPDDWEERDVEALKPLQKLNARQRMIIILSDVEEKKLNEIAEMMKLPVGTVKSNLHRAREIIKKEIDFQDERILSFLV